MAGRRRQVAVPPSAARLTGSLRDIGYDLPSAVADLVDNSIAAGATTVAVDIDFDGIDSRITIADDGSGMTANSVNEALRFGSRRSYQRGDLGRYGLGLKTASLSQCRCLTVLSRWPNAGRSTVRQLNLDVIEDWDEWLIIDPGATPAVKDSRVLLERGFNTVVVWEKLDRVLPESRPDGGWARRRFESLRAKTAEHLSIVFHRFLEEADGLPSVTLLVNGEKLMPWNPFALSEPHVKTLQPLEFELTVGEVLGKIRLERYVLPPRDAFSSPEEFERLAGPMKWNRQQGLYVYRAGRLVQYGGWSGIRAVDEHTKLARAAVLFDTDLDSAFNINVAKMRVSIPPELRQLIERPILEVCARADAVYRRTARGKTVGKDVSTSNSGGSAAARTAGLALLSAAIQSGDYDALKRMTAIAEEQAPGVLDYLGLQEV